MGSFEGRKDKGETRQLYYNLKTKTKTHCSLPLLIPLLQSIKWKKNQLWTASSEAYQEGMQC